MRLRNREKGNEKATRSVDDDNEEDVDDPAVDSDSDPEWAEDPEERNDQVFAKKRKSFVPIPLQMQNHPPKLNKVEETTLPKAAAAATPQMKSGPSGYTLIEPPVKLTSDHTKKNIELLNKSNSLLKKPIQSVPGYNITNQTMNVTDRKGVVNTCSYKILKVETPTNVTASSSSKTVMSSSTFINGDFVKDISKKDSKNCIWQVDGMNLLQKFIPVKDEKTGKTLYKSSFTYDGLNAMNSSRFQKISATIVKKLKNEVFVQVAEEINPLDIDVKTEPISENEVTSSEPESSIKKTTTVVTPSTLNLDVIPDTPSIANYKNTFKDDFTVFLQALISQSIDNTFLRTVYSDKDQYFIDKIKSIDDVLEAKKFSLMSLPTFPNNGRLLYAIHTYPTVQEKQLPAIKMENFNCVGCAEQSMQEIPVYSNVCLELKGEPYERNSLLNVALLVDVDEDYKVLRVCTSCSKILKLYSKMCHTKYMVYKQCERSVKKIQENNQNKEMDASEVIINLLNNDPWCETKLLQIIKDWITVDDMKKESQSVL